MKKTLIRAIALMLIAVTMVCCLASCGGIKSGKYYNGSMDIKTYTQYEFKGNKYTFSSYVAGEKLDSVTVEGTYKIDGEEIIFTWENDEGDKEKDTKSFEKTENGVKIGKIEYKLIEK